MKLTFLSIFTFVALLLPSLTRAQNAPVTFDIFSNNALVNETFDSGIAWSTLGNPAASLNYTLTVPEGISANLNDECRSGNGCTYSGSFINQHTGGVGSSIQLKGLSQNSYTLALSWTEIGGLNRSGLLTDSVVIDALPTPNNPPTIKTTYLPIAYAGSFYSKKIIVLDSDKDSSLSLQSISGLPRGLTVDAIEVNDDVLGTKMEFHIKGKPRHAGTFSIQITVNDGVDTVSTTLKLRVKRI